MRQDQPSKTARKVAHNIISLGSKPGMETILPAGIVDATADLLIASGASSTAMVRLSKARAIVALNEAFDWMMPGQFEAFGHRKAFCERQAREGIAEGATQVLVLGAGYDTMGWRLAPDFASVDFFEIDHPATSNSKARGIAKIGTRANLHLIAQDLADRSLVEVLESEESWDRAAPSVIIAEGLLMYLPPAAVHDLFEHCAAVSGHGSRIAFTHIAAGADGEPDVGRWTGLVLWTLRVTGEPWMWSIGSEALGPFLQDTGWSIAPQLAPTTGEQGVESFVVAVR